MQEYIKDLSVSVTAGQAASEPELEGSFMYGQADEFHSTWVARGSK